MQRCVTFLVHFTDNEHPITLLTEKRCTIKAKLSANQNTLYTRPKTLAQNVGQSEANSKEKQDMGYLLLMVLHHLTADSAGTSDGSVASSLPSSNPFNSMSASWPPWPFASPLLWTKRQVSRSSSPATSFISSSSAVSPVTKGFVPLFDHASSCA